MTEAFENKTVVLALTVSYNGEPFCGFAKQPGRLTVQGSLEEALSLIFRHPVETVCSGRTDSGVHARGQIVSFELPEQEWRERSEFKVLRSLNALTHESIAIKDIKEKPQDFSARFSAISREYRYFICTDPHAPLLMQDFCWHLGKKLDLIAMNKAASYLIGEHDFKSFCMAASAEGKPTHRYVASLKIEPCAVWGENLVCITIVGNAFLHSMVRTIVGTLVMVGLGKRNPEWMKEVLEAKSRSAAGENAPAQGLVFWQVNYLGKPYYSPDAAKVSGTKGSPAVKLNQNSSKSNSKEKTEKKTRKSFSDFFEEHKRRKPEEMAFVIPRGAGSASDDPVFGDNSNKQKLNVQEQNKSVLESAFVPEFTYEEMEDIPASAIKNQVKSAAVISHVVEDVAVANTEAFEEELDSTVDVSAEVKNVSVGEPFLDNYSADVTGKLPLTTSAWTTGKLEPVVAKEEEQVDYFAKPSEEIAERSKEEDRAIAKQAMDNLKHLQKTEGKAFGKRTYPFQRK